MRGGFAAGAAIPGIIRRRLQPGGRADAAFAAIDRGIEQFRQRRPDRLHVGPRRLGIWRLWISGFCGLFGECRGSSPWPEYGMSPADRKGQKAGRAVAAGQPLRALSLIHAQRGIDIVARHGAGSCRGQLRPSRLSRSGEKPHLDDGHDELAARDDGSDMPSPLVCRRNQRYRHLAIPPDRSCRHFQRNPSGRQNQSAAPASPPIPPCWRIFRGW